MKQDTDNLFLCSHCGGRHSVGEGSCPISGGEILTHHRLVGRVLEGKYSILRVLGKGGMGVVFEAKHMLIGRRLAVKVLSQQFATQPEIVERFYNEARTAASIGHDHIIEITDMGSFEGSPFIVMEFLEGHPLTKLIEGGMLPVEEAVGIILQVLDALNAVHAEGVIHRDLKPDNIYLIEKRGRKDFVKILDFGISKLKTPQTENLILTRTGVVLGTPYYMAPEQAAGRKDQDHRVDIYAAGVILYEMLTGRVPFVGDNYNALIATILTEEPTRPTIFNPKIPVELENVIMTAMAKQRHARYSNASSFIEALRPFAPSWILRSSRLTTVTSADITEQGFPGPVTPLPEKGGESVGMSTLGVADTIRLDVGSKKRGRRALVIAGLLVVLLLASGVLAFIVLPALTGEKGPLPKVEELVGGGPTAAPASGERKVAEVQAVVAPNGGPASPSEGGAAFPHKRVKLSLVGVPEGAEVSLDGKKLAGATAYVAPSAKEREIRVEARGGEIWVGKRVIDRDMEVVVVMEEKPSVGAFKGKGSHPSSDGERPVAGKKKPSGKVKPEKLDKVEDSLYKGKAKLMDLEYPE